MPASVLVVVVVASGVVYHLAQKGAGGASPWPVLIVAYAVALALSLGVAQAGGHPARWHLGRPELATGIVLGVAAFGIEAGYFFLYRSGWPLASASVIVNVAVTSILTLVGILVFREPVTAARAGGIVLAAAGTALIVRG